MAPTLQSIGNLNPANCGQSAPNSIRDYLNIHNRRLSNHDADLADLCRRIENIERILGVSFSQPREQCNVPDINL